MPSLEGRSCRDPGILCPQVHVRPKQSRICFSQLRFLAASFNFHPTMPHTHFTALGIKEFIYYECRVDIFNIQSHALLFVWDTYNT